MKKIILALLCLFFICGCSKEIKVGKINCEQMETLMSQGNTKLIDVRDKSEYSQGHLDRAVNIPVSKLTEELLYIDKKTAIIVYCETGTRSAKAFEILKGAGYRKIYDLGAMSNCKK